MRILSMFFFLLPLVAFSQGPERDFVIRKANEKDIISCPHSGHTVTTRDLGPLVSPYKKSGSKAVEFIPEYINVPRTFQNTVEFVLEQLSNFVSTEVPIYVSVEYADLGGGSGGNLTLGQASPGQFVVNFPGAEYINTLYPIALAEKLAGEDLNPPGEPDIIISVNSNRNANFSVTPNSPVIGSRPDLATVLIHEIIHGLGFIGIAGVDSEGRGVLGASVYSQFLEDRDGINYLSSYQNNTTELGDELTSESVFFNGPRFEFENRPKVHAPRSYLPTSSIFHLDFRTYGNTQNRLMGPLISGGDINYNPGIAIDMLHDMGWFTTNFVHDSQGFNEDITQDFTIRTKVRTDSQVDESTVKLHYSRDTFQNEDIIVCLPKDESAGDFFFTLPATNTFTVYQYYFEVQDDSLGLITTPLRAPDSYYQYISGEDTEGPILTGHIPVSSIRETDRQFTLAVNEFTDFFTGVDTSSLAVVVNLNGTLDTIPFERMEDGFGEFYEISYQGDFRRSDQLGYKIILFDKSINRNEGQLPEEGGFYTVEIEEIAAAIVSYDNNFDIVSSDFRGNGFEITQAQGFASPAIHSEHPYQTAGTGTLDFTYELSQLIVIDSVNPTITFDEIVIVEKGDAGTICRGVNCTFEFWDYVVVEAKEKNEIDWLPLLNAYDSRDKTIWLNAYDAGDEGDPNMYRSRTIDMTEFGNFSVGDEIFVRFRLFSDPAANGWGWAIDNLEIQPIETATLDQTILNQFLVSPNPVSANQDISIDLSFRNEFTGVLKLMNTNGQTLISKAILRQFNYSSKLDVSGLSSGIYYLNLSNQEGVSTRKLVIN